MLLGLCVIVIIANNRWMPVLAVLAGGLLYFSLSRVIWGQLPEYNPLFQWLLNCCSSESWFRNLVYTQDLIINIILALPLGYLIFIIKPGKPLLFLALAVLPGFVLGTYHLLTPEYSSENYRIFFPGWFLELFSVPIAFLLILGINRVRNT